LFNGDAKVVHPDLTFWAPEFDDASCHMGTLAEHKVHLSEELLITAPPYRESFWEFSNVDPVKRHDMLRPQKAYRTQVGPRNIAKVRVHNSGADCASGPRQKIEVPPYAKLP
jgi:hypothetical protein